MDRLRKLFKREQQYEPLEDGTAESNGDISLQVKRKPGFSYVEYGIFLLLGISMLWAWNMFLAAGPYFQHRFRDNDWIFNNFQAAEISVSTITNLGSMLILTRLQAGASYPKRIVSSLIINMITFALLALSTEAFLGTSPQGYFGFLMVMIFSTSL
jgi:solute carrier family 29 (equilibrative nucleoside transporter), member 1/2/3